MALARLMGSDGGMGIGSPSCGAEVRGRLEGEGLEARYRIDGYDRMPPFLMSVVSESDLWMFVSSAGGLTAGRRRPEHCLFPYETDDRLHVSGSHTGSLALVRISHADGSVELWEPLSGVCDGRARRSLSKSVYGCFVEFEERREDLGLVYRCRWSPSASFGFVRTVSLSLDAGGSPLSLEVLDGVRGVMASGVELEVQRRASTLADAYKRSELDSSVGLGVYCLEARISDRPEPAESLRANAVWSCGFEGAGVLLSTRQVGLFRGGGEVSGESLCTGECGAYLLCGRVDLGPGDAREWDLVAEVNLAQEGVVALRDRLRREPDLRGMVRADLERGARTLARLVGEADGDQLTEDEIACAHHRSNVLFNVMRGGIFASGYGVECRDLRSFVSERNGPVGDRHASFFESLGARVDHPDLVVRAAETEDPDLERLCHEYLPLTFSRRHGDPSRPWNLFDIRVEGPDGSSLLSYEGNWRDIFQNWEALCESFPLYAESVIAKFVNASTIDGFNPYRIGRDGIGWEESDPSDPWSNIGYWGDHQIVYLLRLLESSRRHRPSALRGMLHRRIFSYADVPYRIRSYESLLRNPKSTIEFDHERAAQIEERVSRVGVDGRLVHGRDGGVHHVGLVEKLLVPALSKLSNMVEDGGVWLNTQRPEWNDANNALAGFGLSMVTMFHLRRYLSLCIDLFRGEGELPVELSSEVGVWFDEVLTALTETLEELEAGGFGASERRSLLDRLGGSFSRYRERVYEGGFSGRESRPMRVVTDFCRIARHHVDHAIAASRREDGLFHSYNLMEVTAEGGIEIRRLPEMLEGQVAAIGSGLLDGSGVLSVVEGLFSGPLYREDQRSFVLYPACERRSYLERNVVPRESVEGVDLLSKLVDSGDRSVVVRDAEGRYRFNSDFRSGHDLRRALARLEGLPGWAERVRSDGARVHEVFESVFGHRAFLGRSGTMYKYEGLGCVYWHMVSKLLLSVQECFFESWDRGESSVVLGGLADAYREIRSGLGFNKTPAEHGAVPIDPYSHTPRHIGAQQPGMTGQVKEGVLIRLGELGVRVVEGRLRFQPRLLSEGEFLGGSRVWESGVGPIELDAGSLGFTLCGVPIVYRLAEGAGSVECVMAGGRRRRVDGDALEEQPSAELFGRTGRVSIVEVRVPRGVPVESWRGDAGV